ncbi:hypothetical protein [Rodentibacter haemolyticus]|uniref:DUF8095 domain-containing protein n=1 Tax=Rodentibacter haemolyticus TaxID=2778911 RepID=A0ABX6UY63_9PAST|nr:hypothetical protein [Rodentibacter haemolyticus]QPB42984.1 hypothetical protein IHV77_02350 [Rodentibacter haemolyticus]
MSCRKKINISLLFFSTLSTFSFSTFANTSQTDRETEEVGNLVRYVDSKTQETLEPENSLQDTKKLAGSIEFSVYVVNEEFSSHSVFVSNAGICDGFEGNYGVDFTNTTSNYVNRGDKSQYYGGITGASIYKEKNSTNLRYAPVYVINNAQLEKKIRKREEGKIEQTVKDKIDISKAFLDKTICKPGKK